MAVVGCEGMGIARKTLVPVLKYADIVDACAESGGTVLRLTSHLRIRVTGWGLLTKQIIGGLYTVILGEIIRTFPPVGARVVAATGAGTGGVTGAEEQLP